MIARDTRSGTVRFGPLAGADAALRLGVVFFGCIALLSFLAFLTLLVSGDEETGERLAPAAGSAVFCGALALWCARLCRTARAAYVCDDTGIRRVLGGSETELLWREIDDVEFPNFLGLGEVKIVLHSSSRGETLVIRTEYVEKGGRSLVEHLFERLPELLDAKTQRYIDGLEQWRGAFGKDVVRFEGGSLHVEFPPGVHSSVHLTSIRRVEWVPGAVSGANGGTITIDHAGGSMPLPQTFQGVPFFLRALERHCGLGAAVNPGPREETELDRVRVQSGNRAAVLIGSAVLLIVSLVGLISSNVTLAEEWFVRARGHEVEATVTEKLPDCALRLEYAVAGERHESEERVSAELHERIREGETIVVRTHAKRPSVVQFDERRPPVNPWVGVGVSIVFLAVTLSLIARNLGAFKQLQRRAGELDEKQRRLESRH